MKNLISTTHEKLRGIYFIDPEDKEFKETIKNKNKTKLACILEASESTRLRVEDSLPNDHEDHFAGNGDNSLQHKMLVHEFILVPQAMKIPTAKAAVDK